MRVQLVVSILEQHMYTSEHLSLDINNNLAGIASISPDGKYLFFGRNGDIYWVRTKIIEELKPDELK